MRKKKTGRTIKEKAARMPEIREAKWDQIVPEYLESVQTQISEPAKSHRFLLLLNDLFGIQPGFIEEYVSGIEKYVKVKQKDRILRGEVDNLFGNMVIEFERDFIKKQIEAEGQLRKYIACLWSQEETQKRTPYLCIATDGISFIVYSPAIEDLSKRDIQPEEVQVALVEKIDLSSLKPQEVYFWLDRYFLRKEILSPKTENIVKDFGIKSHAFQIAQASLLSLWERVKEISEFKVVYESWEKYLYIVYGTSVAERELFTRHTYLAILAKLMVWSRLSKDLQDADQILSVLGGQFFKYQGIENFLEEDFFSWIVRKDAKDTGVEIARKLLSLLRNYHLKELSEDVLKSLYQELVDPKTRHDLGEFYTPDWLAHRMVQKLMDQNPEGSFLDPACGSGTFLYLVIREKRDRLPDTHKTLEHILNSVFGVDIHPLAVIVAKTNYLLALGDLLKKRRGKISIPIYLSDTMRLPEREVQTTLWIQVPSFKVKLDEKEIYLPEKLLEEPALYDEAIDAVREFATQNIWKGITESHFLQFIQAQYPDLIKDTNIAKALFHIFLTLKDFIEQNRDTIWAFVLKNIYKPLFLKGRFDFIIGNPPWLAFRYAELGYQKFLKEEITENYNLFSGRGELITHLELGTLFFLRTADLYLKGGGTISFVLPRSIFSADQHDGLRQAKFRNVNLNFREIWDLEKVEPLFNVPSCVLIAQKQPKTEVSYPITGQKLRGRLDRRNAPLDDAEESLSVDDVKFYLHKRGKRSFWSIEKSTGEEKESFYKKHFFQGATIVPRSFWFVEGKDYPLGFNPNLPLLETSKRIKPGPVDTYRDVEIKGNVESDFLYYTFLGDDLLPFGCRDLHLIVLPIEPSGNGYRLINAEEARKRGFIHLANWLEKAEKEWENRRGAKAKEMDIYERLDRYRGLTRQNPQTKYRVLYPKSATYLYACIVQSKKIEFNVGGQRVQASGVVVDYNSFYLETEDGNKALFLSSIFNAPIIDKLIKPMQSRGKFGPWNICKKVLELPIPQFDPFNKIHLRLAELGKLCSQKVSEWVQSGGPGKIKSIGVLRSRVRETLKEELEEIDGLVQQILKT